MIKKAKRAWYDMINRCYNRKALRYNLYGARGITVCDRWRSGFENFLTDMGLPKPGLSLDRIDNEKGYYPENCRWTTQKQQNRNMRSNRKILQYSLDGKLLNRFNTLAEASEKTGAYHTSLSHIINGTSGNRTKANGFIWKLEK